MRPCFFGQAMHITVKLFASFRTGRFSEQVRPCSEGCMAGQLVAELGIAEAEVGVLLVNGCHVIAAQPLAGGDTLSIFPRIGGG